MGVLGSVLAGVAVVVPVGSNVGILGNSMRYLMYESIPGKYTQCLALFWHLLIPMGMENDESFTSKDEAFNC